MNARTIGLLAAAIAALSPAVSDASPETAALDACARAFAASLASPGAAAPAFTVVFGGAHDAGSVTDFFARQFTFDLHASDSKTGAKIARATCSTDRHGTVVNLSAVPIRAERATLAAR
jgi:hypothetical protein